MEDDRGPYRRGMAKHNQYVVETLTSANIRWQSSERREASKRKRWLAASLGAEVEAMAMVGNKVGAAARVDVRVVVLGPH
jgi:DNA-binding NtrC family response regulator